MLKFGNYDRYTTGSFRHEALNYNGGDECHNETCGAPEELSNAKTYWIDTKIFGDVGIC